jgi:hypothetical protein
MKPTLRLFAAAIVAHALAGCATNGHSARSLVEPAGDSIATDDSSCTYPAPGQIMCIGTAYGPVGPNGESLK